VVESAVVLPLIIFMMLAVAEVGRAIAQYNMLTKSVQDAARYLAGGETDPTGKLVLKAEDVTVAKNLVVYGTPDKRPGSELLKGLSTSKVTVGAPFQDSGTGVWYVTVQAEYAFEALFAPFPTFGLGGGDGITLGPYVAMATMPGLRI
jgi:Flp pilus assembly protein TadG